MASFRKRGLTWTAEVRRKGVSISATFSTKAEAQAWAAKTEVEIIAGKRGDVPNKTFGQLLEKYRDEVSPSKKGERWERLRIGVFQRDEIASVMLSNLDERAVSEWRDRRLKTVSSATVRREWNLLSNACSVAVKEWKWLTVNPMANVRKPKDAPPRDRIATQDEIEKLAYALSYDKDTAPQSVISRVGAAMLFAIETAMRAGEICNLKWADIQIERKFLKVTGGKTTAAMREVPLSTEAIRVLKQLEQVKSEDDDRAFQLAASQIDSHFRKAKARTGIDDITFHDMRHTAVTRLAKKIDILPLAKMIGHRDLKMLMVYFSASAESLADKLD